MDDQLSDNTKADNGVPIDLGEEVGGRGRIYFDNVVTDNILDALLELSAAVWTSNDRIMVLEKVLEDKGIAVSEAIEAHVPDQAEIERRAEARDAFVDQIFGAFLRRPTHKIGQAAEENQE